MKSFSVELAAKEPKSLKRRRRENEIMLRIWKPIEVIPTYGAIFSVLLVVVKGILVGPFAALGYDGVKLLKVEKFTNTPSPNTFRSCFSS